MRKLKLIILLMGLQLIIKAQPYVPMPTTKAVWTISRVNQGAIRNIDKYGMYGDTIINNVSYKKIYSNYDFNFNISSANTYYSGAIREYSKKIYCIRPGTSNEGVLYDFNITIGDAARIINYYGNLIKHKVSGFNFIVYNGIVHRKWIFQSGEYWLEGIGSSYGLLHSFCNAFDLCEDLVCLSIDGTVQYHNTAPLCFNAVTIYDCDGGFVSVNELSINNQSIIFPNPFSNSAILKTSMELNDATLKVYDMLGREVLKETNLNGQEIKIVRENLNSGNYYYHLSKNGYLISKGKFIVE